MVEEFVFHHVVKSFQWTNTHWKFVLPKAVEVHKQKKCIISCHFTEHFCAQFFMQLYIQGLDTAVQYSSLVLASVWSEFCWLIYKTKMSLYLLSVQVLSMAVRPLNTIFLFLLIAASMMGQGESHTESEAVYLKLENALLTDQNSRYMMQRAFFPSQDFSPD